jgi:hypothetical protein
MFGNKKKGGRAKINIKFDVKLKKTANETFTLLRVV